MAVDPEVEQVDCVVGSAHYCLKRVVLTVAAKPEELAAMAKLYPTRKQFGGRHALAERTRQTLDKIGHDQDYMVVDATGAASAVVARQCCTSAGLIGKRVLLRSGFVWGVQLRAEPFCPTHDSSAITTLHFADSQKP